VITSIRYSTIETKEVARIGYNGFLFPHEYSGDGLGAMHLGCRPSTHAEKETHYIVLLNGYFHIKPVLCLRQSYWVEVSCIGPRQRRGPTQLIEAQYDCTRT
jgi:hypothetical protein